MAALFFSALLLGLVFNAAPGAVFAETIRRGVRGGFKPAFAVQIGSLAGDSLWAVLGLAGVGVLLQLDALRLPIGIAGVLYLLWLAWDTWRAADKECGIKPGAPTLLNEKALRSGMLLSITNPQNVAYWAALGSAMGAVGISQPTPEHYAVFFAGFMAASLLWAFICAGLVAFVYCKAGMTWSRLTYRACAIAFLLLALSSLRNLWDSYVAPQDVWPPTAIQSEG
jgi:chemosensory pili system protein ChpE/L-lysine exporter family protein LysE/ArgO